MKNILLCALISVLATRSIAKDLKTSRLYSGASATEVYGFCNIDIGYAQGTLTDTATGTGGDFVGRFELGAKFLFPTRKDNRSWMFSASAAYCMLHIAPPGHSIDFKLITVPLSIGQFSEGNNRKSRGIYWQVGTNINYVFQVTERGHDIKAGFVKLFAEPFVSFGLAQPGLLMGKKFENEECRTLIGPFASYLPGNLAKSPNTMSGWTLGIRWTSIIAPGR